MMFQLALSLVLPVVHTDSPSATVYTVAEMLIPGDMEKVIEWAITILIPHLARERVVTVIAFPESLHT
jgi:hypothetical protein